MSRFLDQLLAVAQLAGDWFLVQPLHVQIVVGAVGLAVLWVLWILLRVISAAVRAAFRGL